MPTTLQVFDPAMCCSTGVCGPQVDPALVQFASDLRWIKSKGIAVERYNLSQDPQAFVRNPLVIAEMKHDPHVLPLLFVDGEIKRRGTYPTRGELADMVGLEAPPAPQLLTVLRG